MNEEIQQAISVLVGQPLWALGRAADLAWFEFGQRRTVTGFKGDVREVGDYALHVVCAWRITLGDRVIVGRADIFRPPDEIDEPKPPDFDWDKGNRFDRIVKELFQNESRQFMPLSVAAGGAGSFSIDLQDGYRVEVFPQDFEGGEQWRLFSPSTDAPHFVFTCKGIEDRVLPS